MVKAVVFDMDGVMYDTERLSHKSWLEVCREMGCTIKEEDLLSFRGRPREMNEQQYAHFEGTNGVSYKVLRKGRDRRMQQYFALHGIPVKPGLYELMDFLKKNGIRTGVATGTARDIALRTGSRAGKAGTGRIPASGFHGRSKAGGMHDYRGQSERNPGRFRSRLHHGHGSGH